MERRQSQIFFCHSLIQKRLYIRLRIDSASPGDVIDTASPGCHVIEFFNRHSQNRSHLIDKSPCSAGTASVHPHICHCQCSGLLVLSEKDHLRVLSSQLNGCADTLIPIPQCQRICHHFLYKRNIQRFRNTLRARPGQYNPKLFFEVIRFQTCQSTVDTSKLVRMMSLVIRIQHLPRLLIHNRDLCRRGTHINSY